MRPTERDYAKLRQDMVARQISARGVRSKLVLSAMRKVPREQFLPKHLWEFAYDDVPLPIEGGQTISQPYIVALMIEALGLRGGEKVLEIGTGSGYAAAVLGEIAGQIYSLERIDRLAETAHSVLQALGYKTVRVRHADGTLGWQEEAPFDAIVVAASGPDVPDSLKRQLRIGGTLVIPVGANPRVQELRRIKRVAEDRFESEDIADVRFVPLIGEQGWAPEEVNIPESRRQGKGRLVDAELPGDLLDVCQPFSSVQGADIDGLLKRIGDARIVLLGESTHGTTEFYRMRQRISEELISQKGFNFIAIEADWPDAARLDHYVRDFEYPPSELTVFARFPTWMWRNNEARDFVDWLRTHNRNLPPERRVAIYGLDIYSLYTSIRMILSYLDKVDPASAQIARKRYTCLTPWQADPASYGQSALSGTYHTCEGEVATMLRDILRKQNDYALHDGERFFDIAQNAQLVADAEQYYRVLYYGSRDAWNLRDTHMFETLKKLLAHRGSEAKAIVWAHNSHVGDSAAMELAARGEHNIGGLCRSEFGQTVYTIGFGTDNGTVAAASSWDGPMQIKQIPPSLQHSYDNILHKTGIARFLLPLRHMESQLLRMRLERPRLQRAIGVVYNPESEVASHYFQCVLPRQFDEYIWFDKSSAIHPLSMPEHEGLPDTYPFGL